jgi:uncharacterized damage-inducible protein DinB
VNAVAVLADGFSRIRGAVRLAAEGATAEQLAFRPDAAANSIAWLIWHLTRIEDDHVSALAGVEQAWTAQGFQTRFDLPFDAAATGYGQAAAEVAAVRPDGPEPLLEYHDAVARRTAAYLQALDDGALDRIVDESWDPPVSAGVRLVSVIADALEHAGQAAYLRGLVDRRYLLG